MYQQMLKPNLSTIRTLELSQSCLVILRLVFFKDLDSVSANIKGKFKYNMYIELMYIELS